MAPRKKKKVEESPAAEIVVFDENHKLDAEALKNMLRDFEFKNISDTQKTIMESLRRIEAKVDESTEGMIAFVMGLLSGNAAGQSAQAQEEEQPGMKTKPKSTEFEQNTKLAQNLREAFDDSKDEEGEEYVVFLRLNEEFMKQKKVYPMQVMRGKWSAN